MSKSKDTKALAKMIEAFCAEQKIRIKHTQALELAARFKGHRDLHEDQQVNAPTTKKNYDVWIVWGSEDTMHSTEGEWDEMENSPCRYSFATEAERDAFLQGVSEAEGWLDLP